MEVRTYVHQYAIHIHAIMQDTIAVDMQQKEKKILVSDGVPDPAVSRVLLKRKDKQPFQTAARAENLSRSLKMCRKNTIYQVELCWTGEDCCSSVCHRMFPSVLQPHKKISEFQ